MDSERVIGVRRENAMIMSGLRLVINAVKTIADFLKRVLDQTRYDRCFEASLKFCAVHGGVIKNCGSKCSFGLLAL